MSTMTYQTVVVPVDFSEDSERAISVGLQSVADPANLHIVHVMFPLDYAAPGVLYGTTIEKDRRTNAEENLRTLAQQSGAPEATRSVLVGDPGLKVADYAEQVGAELVIIPSHGYHGVKRLLLGSTAERIIRYARCSVLVLRRQDAD